MSEKKKEVQLSIDQIPAEGALGLLALGDVGVKLWREARKLKAEKKAIKNSQENEQKEG